jgi:nucleoside-diphosphate-sugar epimerase
MRCNLLVNDFVYSAIKSKKIEVFEPNVSRSFINVLDMAKAVEFFMNEEKHS